MDFGWHLPCYDRLATRENLDAAPVRELLAPDLSILGG